MLKITNILNPLTGGAVTEEYVWESGKPLSGYMDYDGECVVACKEIISLPLSGIFPADTEEYMVMPIPEGGDRETWRVLGVMAQPLLKHLPGWWPIAFLAGSALISYFLRDKDKDQDTSESYAWQHKSSPTAAHGIPMSVIYGKTRIRPVLKNRYITWDGDKEYLYVLYGIAAHKVDDVYYERFQPLSVLPHHTYNWNDIVRTPLNADEPGKTYRCKRDGTTGISYLDDNRWEVWRGTAAFSDDIIVNGRAIQDYNKDVGWETRPGLPEQAVIMGFDVTYSNFAQDEFLYSRFVEIVRKEANITYTASSNLLSWSEHTMLFQNESYRINAGHLSLRPGNFYYLYFTTTEEEDYVVSINAIPPNWIAKVNLDDKDDEAYQKLVYRKTIPRSADKWGDWYEPVLTLTAAHNIELVFQFPYGLYGSPTGTNTITADCMLFAQYREKNVGNWLNFSSEFSDPDWSEYFADEDIRAVHVVKDERVPFTISLQAVLRNDALEYEKDYEVRVAASSPSIVKLVNVATIVYGEANADGSAPGFTYPGEPLLGIKALASGQISGDLDVQVDVERSKVWVYDGTDNYPDWPGWNTLAANNHAWAVYDILAQGHPDHPAYVEPLDNKDAEAIYGCGIDHERIDYTSFKAWADNINALGYELNIVFDVFMPAWDAILRICQEGRGMVFPVGTKIYAFTDKAEDVTQVFTMGNIHLDTFTQKYMEANTKINMVEVNYYDRERNYGKTTIAARTTDWDSSQGLSVPTTITLYGTTTFDQAWSIARSTLRGNELLDNIILFGVDVDALASQAGDVVGVQHDLLTTGQGGRIKEVTEVAGAVTIVCDRTLSDVVGQEYQLVIYHNDGTIETQSGIEHGNISGDTLTFGAVWSWDKIPEADEPYSFGIEGSHVKEYRIAEISRTSELMRTLTLIQYDEGIYDSYVPSDNPPVFEEGEVPLSKIAPPDTTVETLANLLNIASNLQLREIISKNRVTGESESSIVATWDTVLGNPRGAWEVWFRDVDVSDVDWDGTWSNPTPHDRGEKVELDGKVYISLVDDNVSQPLDI